MPQEVFIDASLWIARMHRGDEHYDTAQELWLSILEREWHRVTTNWTLYEALTFLSGGKRRHDLALSLLSLAYDTADVVDASTLEEQALDIFKSHTDKRWSVVDCANFVCIRERRSSWALAFDKNFDQAQAEFGFSLLGVGAAG